MDDEEALRNLLAKILKRLGSEVECAREGAEAIELYQKAKASGLSFDVVLVDLTVPGGMGGKELAARLREIDISVRLIVSSGYYHTPIMSEYRRYGFDDVISKPWTPPPAEPSLTSLRPAISKFENSSTACGEG
jgi:two-component system cell cycle sensor histidine kinase/response regulator CckA